jgi:hypothetical protein
MNAVGYFDFKFNVTVWFHDRGFVKTLFKRFLGKRDCFRVSCDCRLLKMPKTHFWSMGATQNKSDVTNRFGDRDFVLAVCTCFIRKCGRLEVIRDIRSFKNGGIPFPVDGSTAEQKWCHHSISGWRFSFSLCRNFPFIFLRSKVIQEFHVCVKVKIF